MRTLVSLVFAAVLSTTAMAAEATDFTLTDINGKKVSLSDFQDQVVVMSFWATWCGPCKKEMPHLQKMYNERKEEGFTVLSVSIDDARSASQVKPFIRKNKYDFPVLLDKQSKVIQQYNPSKQVPFTVVISEGQVIETHSGFNPGDEKHLEEKVDALIAGKAPAKEE